MTARAGADDVVLRVGGSPENVRTARLVAAAVARREGLPEDRVDEVRIAVGEAVTWAMHAVTGRVVELVLGPGADGTGEFVVRVGGGMTPVAHGRDRATDEQRTVDVTAADPGADVTDVTDAALAGAVGEPAATDALALALLRGLADHVTVDGDTTVLTWDDADLL